MRRIRWTTAAALVLLTAVVPARAGDDEAKSTERPGTPGIAWFGTLDAGVAEAKRSGRPIFLLAAAPQCHEVPGVW